MRFPPRRIHHHSFVDGSVRFFSFLPFLASHLRVKFFLLPIFIKKNVFFSFHLRTFPLRPVLIFYLLLFHLHFKKIYFLQTQRTVGDGRGAHCSLSAFLSITATTFLPVSFYAAATAGGIIFSFLSYVYPFFSDVTSFLSPANPIYFSPVSLCLDLSRLVHASFLFTILSDRPSVGFRRLPRPVSRVASGRCDIARRARGSGRYGTSRSSG